MPTPTTKLGADGNSRFTVPPIPPPAILMPVLVHEMLVPPELTKRFFPGFEIIDTELIFEGDEVIASILKVIPLVFVVCVAG